MIEQTEAKDESKIVATHKAALPYFLNLVKSAIFILSWGSFALGVLFIIGSIIAPPRDPPVVGALVTLALLLFVFGYIVRKSDSTIVKLISKGHLLQNKGIASLEKKVASNIQQRRELKSFEEENVQLSTIAPVDVVALGGAGWQKIRERELSLSLRPGEVCFSDKVNRSLISIPFEQIREIDIGGPGVVKKGGGFVGGGIGAEGFLAGAALSAALNIVTSHTTTKTIVRLGLIDSELIFSTAKHDPETLRNILSPIFVWCANKSQVVPGINADGAVSSELSRLAEMRKSNILSEEEFIAAKKRVLGIL
jgi:hypothetical protein